jgi:hypothetical protein
MIDNSTNPFNSKNPHENNRDEEAYERERDEWNEYNPDEDKDD